MKCRFALGALPWVLALVACGKVADTVRGVLGDSGPAPEPPAKTLVVLFDLSESTAKPTMRRAYVDAFKAIVGTIHPGDALVAGWITDQSAAELTLPVRLSFPAFSPTTDNPRMADAEKERVTSAVRKQTEDACGVVTEGLTHPSRRVLKTNIMSSLLVAERVFKSYPQPHRVLVIMSDMLEDSENYSFERVRLAPEVTARIIAVERRAGRLPDLAGVRIHVVGASAASDDKLFEVEHFWSSYFRACGAELRNEDYGAALVAFNE